MIVKDVWHSDERNVMNVNGNVAQDWLMEMTYKSRRREEEVCGREWFKHDAGQGP
jgi:hypothetical protein